MSNVPSIGKSIMILLIAAAVGFAGCAAAPPLPTPVERVVRIRVENGALTVDHDPVIVRTDRRDRVVWIWSSEPIEEFTVSIDYDHQHDPSTPALPVGFVNPFQKRFDDAALKLWESGKNGMINSAASKKEAKGHGWKYTIKAGDRKPLDPHTRFD